MPPLDNKVKYFHGWQLDSTDYGNFPPLGLLYIATVLKKNIPDFTIKILDCPSQSISYSKLESFLNDFNPDIIGITVFTLCLVDVLNVARLAKSLNKNVHVCAGGPHLSVYPAQTLAYPQIDSIIIGEGEYIFLELIKQAIEGKVLGGFPGFYTKSDLGRKDFSIAVVNDIDDLPFFDINFLERKFYYSTVGRYRNIITLLSSRGCPYDCTFCDSPYKIYRGRSVENVIEEIELRLRQDFKEIFFYDDTFNITPDRVIDLSLRIIRKNLKFSWSFRGRVNTITFEMLKIAKEAGCQRIHFGIETASNEGLKELKKGINLEQIKNALLWCGKLKIKTIADFIIGLPFEKSRKDVLNNIESLIKFSPDFAQFNILQPIPGSKIYESGIKKGIIDLNKWEDYVKLPRTSFKPPLWTEYLSSNELKDLYSYAYKRFYLRPTVILRQLFSLTTISEFNRILKGGIKILLEN